MSYLLIIVLLLRDLVVLAHFFHLRPFENLTSLKLPKSDVFLINLCGVSLAYSLQKTWLHHLGILQVRAPHACICTMCGHDTSTLGASRCFDVIVIQLKRVPLESLDEPISIFCILKFLLRA